MAAPEMRLERASAFCLSSVPFCSLLFQPEREHHGARGLSRFSRCNRERKSYRAGICYERVSFSLISLKSYEPSGICKCDNKGHSWTILDTIFILSVQLLPVFIILYSYCHCTVCSVLVKKKKIVVGIEIHSIEQKHVRDMWYIIEESSYRKLEEATIVKNTYHRSILL